MFISKKDLLITLQRIAEDCVIKTDIFGNPISGIFEIKNKGNRRLIAGVSKYGEVEKNGEVSKIKIG